MGRKFEEFYHGGNDVLARGETQAVENTLAKIKKKAEDKSKEIAQQNWLDPENPFLWDNYDNDD